MSGSRAARFLRYSVSDFTLKSNLVNVNKIIGTMQRRLKAVDCIVEVHDARLPYTGRNPDFYHLLKVARPHILVLNKSDLADPTHTDRIRNDILQRGEGFADVLFTNLTSTHDDGFQEILPTILETIEKSKRYHRKENADFGVMLIGIPNTGKSSLINMLRHVNMKTDQKATRAGAMPGVTRSVQNKIRVCEDPPVYVTDTPGILNPKIDDLDEAYKLALCGCIDPVNIGENVIAEYFLYWTNKHKNYRYVDVLNLPGPMENIDDLLLEVALALDKTVSIRHSDMSRRTQPNVMAAAAYVLKKFRAGKFGRICLDEERVKAITPLV